MKDKFRMAQWLALAAVSYGLALTVFGSQPQLQTLCWKIGHVFSGVYVGYWADVCLSRKHIHGESTDAEYQRRAIISVGVMLTLSMGL